MLIYTSEPEALRATLRDVFDLTHVDAGDGWLIFRLPPAEVGVHPAGPGESSHHLSFMCDDISQTMADLSARGITFSGPAEDQGLRDRELHGAAGRSAGPALPTSPSARDRSVGLTPRSAGRLTMGAAPARWTL